MSKTHIQQRAKVIALDSFFKVKKLKTKMTKLEIDFLFSSITLMNMEVDLRINKYSADTNRQTLRCEVGILRVDNKRLEDRINSLRQEMEQENNLLMRACIENEDFVQTFLNEDEDAVNKYPEFKLLHEAISMVEGC